MKIRLFIEKDFTAIFELHEDKDVNYLRNVLRCELDDDIFLFNEEVECKYKIKKIDKNKITLSLESKVSCNENINDITLFCPILKKDPLTQVVTQSVELGVKEIIFYKSRFSANGDKIFFNKLHLNAIESLEQCGGFKKLIINEKIINLKDINGVVKEETLFIANEKTRNDNNKSTVKKTNKAFCIVGPEGGFHEDEIKFLMTNRNTEEISLGGRILRAENACFAMCFKVANLQNQ